ncbi:MAG: aldose 1-epimerase family protein [Bacteroidetes bacterium]|nr:aldose 1-epimerase family protein [Bacteroidota bacterium]
MIQLLDGKLLVAINEKGAELQTVQLNGLEYLWQADTSFWAKHSPVLFPIIGELKDGAFMYNNKEYKLSRHGFARDRMFVAEQLSQKAAIFTLQSDEATLMVYPFPFIFQVEYALTATTVACTYHVKNIGEHIMYFSVGGHPAFNVPLNKNLKYKDYALEFNDDEALDRYLLHKGLTGNETEKILLQNKTLPLEPSLFYTDAIVLKHIKSNEIKLFSNNDVHGLKFKFDGFPYFGIWAAVDAPFVCLEPWCGIADNIFHDQQLIHKEGINKLSPGEHWQRTWSIELF